MQLKWLNNMAVGNGVLRTLIDFHAPLVTEMVSPKPPNLWITPDILASKRHCRYLELVWCRNPIALNRSQLTRPTRLSTERCRKQNHLIIWKLLLNTGDQRSSWKSFNKILHRCPNVHLPDHSSIDALANKFSHFFINNISMVRVSLGLMFTLAESSSFQEGLGEPNLCY